MDNNPYRAASPLTTRTSWRDILGRAAAITAHLILWVAFIVAVGPILRKYLGGYELTPSVPGPQLTFLQSFNRFVIQYGFLAIAAGFVVDIGVWLSLRKFRRPTRWRWLAITTALVPLITIATWLATGPFLLLP